MESSTILRSFHCEIYSGGLTVPKKQLFFGPLRRNATRVSCANTSEAKSQVTSDGAAQAVLPKNGQGRATFPNGFETLVQEVCDETEIAELKLKVGDFEMHVKRNIEPAKVPVFNSAPAAPAPPPSKPLEVVDPQKSKSADEKATPFTNVSFQRAPKLAALEASGASGYVLVPSPTVGSFRRNRTVKGVQLPPIIKEGDLIRDGQVIGYVEQFNSQLPVKSDVDGEVIKLLFDEGDAVGYSDPLIAVMPSFHGINT